MHFDLAHAILTGILVYLTLRVLKSAGISNSKKNGHLQWVKNLVGIGI